MRNARRRRARIVGMNGTVAEISIRPLFLILAICAFLSTGWSQTTNTTELTKRLETNLQVKRVDSCKRYTDAYFDGKLIPVVMFEFSIQLRLTIRNLSPEPVMISRRSI